MSTRDDIIATTCTLLELQGFHATGLNQIIAESGTPKGSLYHYFPGGKEALVTEALQRVGAVVRQRIHDALVATPNAVHTIPAFIHSVAEGVAQADYRAGGPITTVAMETASTNPRLRAVCETLYAEWQQLFAKHLAGCGVSHTQTQQLATLIVSALEGGIILCRVQRSPAPLYAVGEQVGLLLALIQRP